MLNLHSSVRAVRHPIFAATLFAHVMLTYPIALLIVLAGHAASPREPAVLYLIAAMWVFITPLLIASWMLFLWLILGPRRTGGPLVDPSLPAAPGDLPPVAPPRSPRDPDADDSMPIQREDAKATPPAAEDTPSVPEPECPVPAPVVPKAQGARDLRLPEVIVSRELIHSMHDYIEKFGAERGSDLEIGGMLTGQFEQATADRPATIRLNGFIDAGPGADCQPGSFLMDGDYQENRHTALQIQHPDCGNLGMFHKHPGTFDQCSTGDQQADREAVKSSSFGILVFIIVTRDNSRAHPQSVRHGRLKFDFYLMGRDLGPDYHAITPAVIDVPMVKPDPNLVQWVEQRGPETRLDWLLLRTALPNAKFTLASTGAGHDLLLKAELDQGRCHVWLRTDGTMRVFLAKGSELLGECPGPWNQPEAGPFIFVTHLILHASRSLRAAEVSRRRHHYLRHFQPHPLLSDKNRLVAEVRAVRERVPEAELKSAEGSLHWLCTIHQHGQSVGLKVEYPVTYPHTPPTVCTLTDLKSGAPHYLSGRRLCWIDFYGSHSEWNPGRDTAATAVIAVQRWFACYLVWLTLKHWPESADH